MENQSCQPGLYAISLVGNDKYIPVTHLDFCKVLAVLLNNFLIKNIGLYSISQA